MQGRFVLGEKMERMGGIEWMGVVERVEEEVWMWLVTRLKVDVFEGQDQLCGME